MSKPPSLADNLPFSESCERNKDVILSELQQAFAQCRHVLEVGSGTGQHAVYFAGQLPHLLWQPTDTGEYLPGLRTRLRQDSPDNVAPPIDLDVRTQPWPVAQFDAMFSANTLHYMATECVEAFFSGADEVLQDLGILAVYGPFRYDDKFTSASNARFDAWLKSADPQRGVRDFEWIDELARLHGLRLLSDTAMPANNQLLVWKSES